MKLRHAMCVSVLMAVLGALWPGSQGVAASSDDWIEALRPIPRGGAGGGGGGPERLRSPWQGLAPGSIPVAFDPGTATLVGPAKAELDRLAAALNSDELRPYEFRMDWSSSSADRLLAERRARSAYEYLLQRGALDARRFGFGKERTLEGGQDAIGGDAIAVRVVNLGE
jgi:hypothetical protein